MSSNYTIEHHKHLFAAWAASRAASTRGCRFTVEAGRSFLEAAGFTVEAFATPDDLPSPHRLDADHRRWREAVIAATDRGAASFTHGVAAKLINVYLKSRFVCAGRHDHPRVGALHPPIDRGMLAALAKEDLGGQAKEWRSLWRHGWSNLDSCEYEGMIELARTCIAPDPLWSIERFWDGQQR